MSIGMSDYIDETPLTDEEIAAAIAAAKKAKADKAKAKKQQSPRKPEIQKSKAQNSDEESSEELFDEIDSVSDEDEELSPKMRSAKSFSNAFAAAKSKREEELKKKKTEKKPEIEEDDEELPDADEEEEEFGSEEFDEDEESEDFDVDDEDDYIDPDEDESIFEADEEDGEYVDEIDLDDDDVIDTGMESDDDEETTDEDYEDEDEEDDDDDESAFSTKTKVVIGIIIAFLVLAIVGAGIFFLTRNKTSEPKEPVSSSVNEGGVTGIHFAEPSISLQVGETVPLQIVIEPENAEDKVLKLKSNDDGIAKVDEQGRITGVSSGSTTVTATLKSNETITATLIVNVIDEDQNAINIYNKFVNSILEGTTDIDSDTETDTETDSDELGLEGEDNEENSTDTDSEENVLVPKKELTGSIIRDLNSDGDLELALYFTGANDESDVRMFHLINEGEEEEPEAEEPQYDEFGNLIESEESDSETSSETDSEKSEEGTKTKILSEIGSESELYMTCFNTLETESIGWNTCMLEIKEEETAAARVTILSAGYGSPVYTYESEDTTIATVDEQGNIKAIKPGVTFITVSSPLNSDAMAKIKVRVKDDTDLLDDYLANIPTVNPTNDPILATETLTGKAIVDLDGDGVSELLLRFDYGSNVETINMVKIENEQCVVYKTYNNISDLYEYAEGKGYYSNAILVHYTTGKICMEYRGAVAKEDSSTKTSEQKIFSLESGGKLSELVNFRTTTDISTKTVTSEVVVEEGRTSSNDESQTESVNENNDDNNDNNESWYDDESQPEDNGDNADNDDFSADVNDEGYYPEYSAFTFDEIEKAAEFGVKISLNDNDSDKKLPVVVGEPGDEDEDETVVYDEPEDENDADADDEPEERVTSTVTSEVTEETTKYFVNGSPVEKSVYEEMLASYSSRYSVWSAWERV